MAKKRRNTKKRHNEASESSSREFLADVPETSAEDWDGDEYSYDESDEEYADLGNDHVVDPYAEHIEKLSEEPVNGPLPESRFDGQEEQEPNYEEDVTEQYPNTDAQENHSFSLGNFLRDQREQQGISLKSVSQSTKISLTNLEYLESDDLTSLPDRAYVTGYVKSYAKLLGTDVNLCLDLLEKTYRAQGASAKEPEIVIPQATNSPKISQGFPAAKIAAVAAMIIIIVGIVGFFMTRDQKPNSKVAVVEEVEVEEQEITPQTLNAETPLQEEMAQQDEEPVDSNESTDTETGEGVDEEISAAPEPTPKKPVAEPAKPKEIVEAKKETPKPADNEEEVSEKKESDDEKENRKFYPLSGELYSIDESLSQEKIDELLPSQFRVTPVDGIQAIFITSVKGDSWLTYKSDNDPIKKFVLKEGRSLLFRAKEARVFLGNLGAVKIFLNNKPLKITSRTGVKSLVFPQENASQYVMPLFIYKEDGSVQTSEDWIKENE